MRIDSNQYCRGGERLIQSDSVTGYEGANIKVVEVRLDYVEFEDKSTLGPDTKGSQIIGQIREGATRYKGWLVEKLRQNGRSVNALVPLLKDRKLPAELEFNSMYLNRGAGVYRSHILDVYNTHGASELGRFLSR